MKKICLGWGLENPNWHDVIQVHITLPTTQYMLFKLMFELHTFAVDLADMVDKMNRDSLIQPEKGDITFNDVIGVSLIGQFKWTLTLNCSNMYVHVGSLEWWWYMYIRYIPASCAFYRPNHWLDRNNIPIPFMKDSS